MSRDENNPTSPQAGSYRRRSSFTANKLSEMFSSARNSASNNSPTNSPPANSPAVFPGSITAAARRLSLSGNLGLSGSTNSPASSGPNSANSTGPERGSLFNLRRGSVSGASEESAIDESGEAVGQAPPSPMGRRMSFGARAMGQIRQNEGFNWADNFANRQSRSGSIGMGGSSAAARNEQTQTQQAKAPEPPKVAPAAPPAPPPEKMKRERPVPDHFQERILKGDFYMD